MGIVSTWFEDTEQWPSFSALATSVHQLILGFAGMQRTLCPVNFKNGLTFQKHGRTLFVLGLLLLALA